MKTSATQTIEQPLVRWRGSLQDTRHFLPAQLEEARQDTPLCPVCKAPGKLDLRSGRPLFVHSANHQAETPERDAARNLLGRWLRKALPGSKVHLNLLWQEAYLDVAIVRSDGARLALLLLSEEPAKNYLLQMQENLAREQTALLCMLASDRLHPRFWKEGAQTLQANFRRAESDLLRIGNPLLYLHPQKRALLLLEPPEIVMPLLQEKRNLGSCQAEVHHYRLSQLRMHEGRWKLDRRFDEPAPKEPEPGKRLLRRLEELY